MIIIKVIMISKTITRLASKSFLALLRLLAAIFGLAKNTLLNL